MRRLAGMLVAMLMFPAGASAWSASRTDGWVGISAPVGETNTLTVDLTAQPPVAHDTTAPYQPKSSLNCPGAAAPECLADAGRLEIRTGDGDDTITLKGESRQTILSTDAIDPGPGRDTVLATGSGRTVVWTIDGEVDTITCSSPKTYVDADDNDVTHGCRVVLRKHPTPVTATVTTTADADGDVCAASCSLRQAINVVSAAGTGTVNVPAGVYDVATPLVVPRDVKVRGAGARSTILRSTSGATVLEFGRPRYPGIHAFADQELSDVTVRCVEACTSASVSILPLSRLRAERIQIVDGQSDAAPAILSAGGLTLSASTIQVQGGGGIKALHSAFGAIENSTISGTSADGAPGVDTAGMFVTRVTLEGGIRGIAPVTGSILIGVCSGAVQSKGGNVLDPSCGPGATDSIAAPQLGPLADNGGPTDTRRPAASSPAIDRAGLCTGADQRGVARPIGTACDSGAVEAGALPPAVDRTKPRVTALKASVRRGRIAAMRKLNLRFKLSEAARVRVTLRGRSVSANRPAGARSLRAGTVLRRTLKPGRYTLKLTAIDAAGNRSRVRDIIIRVKR